MHINRMRKMRQIYLASGSKARKRLLRIFGFKFKIIPSGIKEDKEPIPSKISYARLAEKNALKKARAVAQKVKTGIIIAADTIMVQDKRIFGKPKDILDARLMLKRLSRKPQYIYTGVAVVDKDKNKTLTSC